MTAPVICPSLSWFATMESSIAFAAVGSKQHCMVGETDDLILLDGQLHRIGCRFARVAVEEVQDLRQRPSARLLA
jgi:hypothetical protein